MPCFPAQRMLSRLEQATHSGGWGFCRGLGRTLRSGMEKNSPSYPGYGSDESILAVSPDGFRPHCFFLTGRHVEALEFCARGRFTRAPFHASVADQIEGCDAFGNASRMVVIGGHEYNAVSQADIFGALATGREKDFGC